MNSGTTLTAESARLLCDQIHKRAVPLKEIESFLCRAAIDHDAWARAILYLDDVWHEGMQTGHFEIDDRAFTESEIGTLRAIHTCTVRRRHSPLNRLRRI